MSQETQKSPQSHPPAQDEVVPPADLHAIYLALLNPEGDYVARLKAAQNAAAQYDPNTPGSGAALEKQFSDLIHKPVVLSAAQLASFREIFVDNPAHAHLAPWNHPDCVW